MDTPRPVPVAKPTTATAALLAVTDDEELRDLLLELAIEEGYGVRCVTTDAEAGTVLLEAPAGDAATDAPEDCRTKGCNSNQYCSLCRLVNSVLIYSCIPNGSAC